MGTDKVFVFQCSRRTTESATKKKITITWMTSKQLILPGTSTSSSTNRLSWPSFKASSNPQCSVWRVTKNRGLLRLSCTYRCRWPPLANAACRWVWTLWRFLTFQLVRLFVCLFVCQHHQTHIKDTREGVYILFVLWIHPEHFFFCLFSSRNALDYFPKKKNWRITIDFIVAIARLEEIPWKK